jgi:MFS family permease
LTASFGFHLLTASLPLYALSLGADDAQIGVLGGAVATVALGFRAVAGWWIDAVGGVPPLLVGIALYPLCALAYGGAGAVALVQAVRAVSGVGVAFFATATQALAVDLNPPERRAEALSVYGIGHTLAQGLAPPAGVAIAQAAGYHTLFGLCIVVGVTSVLLAWPLRSIPRAPSQARRRRVFHRSAVLPGILLLALMIPFGVTFGLLPVHAGRRGVGNPGLVFVAFAAGVFLAQTVAGRLSDRQGRSAVILPALLVAAGSMWAVAGLSGWWLFVPSALCGVGMGAGMPSLYAMAADRAPQDSRGAAIGTLGVFHEIGIASGAVVGGFIGRAFGLGEMFVVAGIVPAVAAAAAPLLGLRRAGHPPSRKEQAR